MSSKDNIYEDFSMDDIDLSYEYYEELFGNSHIQTEQLFDDAGISLFSAAQAQVNAASG